MIRDHKMMQLVAKEKEPITPFVHLVSSLYREKNVSTILVIGGAGDYFDVADRVLLMDCYRCEDATEKARAIVAQNPATAVAAALPFGQIRERYVTSPHKLSAGGKVKVQTKGMLLFGDTDLDLRAVEQIVSTSQTSTIASALETLASSEETRGCSLRSVLHRLDQLVDERGLDFLEPGRFHGALTRPRLLDVGGAVNRLRREDSISQQR